MRLPGPATGQETFSPGDDESLERRPEGANRMRGEAGGGGGDGLTGSTPITIDDEEHDVCREQTIADLEEVESIDTRVSRAQGTIHGALSVLAVTLTPESLLDFVAHIRETAIELIAEQEGISHD